MHPPILDHAQKQACEAVCHSVQWNTCQGNTCTETCHLFFSCQCLLFFCLVLSLFSSITLPFSLDLLCVSTVLMIHVLILLCQGPRAASITPSPCLLLAFPALTPPPLQPHQKKKPFVIVSNSDTVSVFKSRFKELLLYRLLSFALYRPCLSLSLHPCALSITCFYCCQTIFTGETGRWHRAAQKTSIV